MEALGSRRSKIELIASILEAAKAGERKTRLIHKSNLDSRTARRLLPTLEGLGLIERDGLGLYRVTDRGLDFLRYFEGMRRLLAFDSRRQKHVL